MSLLVSPARRAGGARLVSLLAASALATSAVAACAPADSTSTTTPAATSAATSAASTAADACTPAGLALHTAGKLTVATDNPVYEPWFLDNKPASGKGYESAVTYAVASKLGFAASDVVWVQASFNSAIAPGPKTFDFDINEVSITDKRKAAVDFSSGYYTVVQAVVTLKGSKIAGAKTIADLKGAKLGAQVGTTSYTTITDVIAPTQKPAVFNTNDDAKLALNNGQIDGLVLDLPTASFEANVDLKNGVLIGKLAPSNPPEQFGLVLDKGSALTTCVSKAVDALNTDGTLKQLEQQWLKDYVSTPVLS